MSEKKLSKINDKIDFGYHKGKTLREIAEKYPNYIGWLIKEKLIDVNPDLLFDIHKFINKRSCKQTISQYDIAQGKLLNMDPRKVKYNNIQDIYNKNPSFFCRIVESVTYNDCFQDVKPFYIEAKSRVLL